MRKTILNLGDESKEKIHEQEIQSSRSNWGAWKSKFIIWISGVILLAVATQFLKTSNRNESTLDMAGNQIVQEKSATLGQGDELQTQIVSAKENALPKTNSLEQIDPLLKPVQPKNSLMKDEDFSALKERLNQSVKNYEGNKRAAEKSELELQKKINLTRNRLDNVQNLIERKTQLYKRNMQSLKDMVQPVEMGEISKESFDAILKETTDLQGEVLKLQNDFKSIKNELDSFQTEYKDIQTSKSYQEVMRKEIEGTQKSIQKRIELER